MQKICKTQFIIAFGGGNTILKINETGLATSCTEKEESLTRGISGGRKSPHPERARRHRAIVINLAVDCKISAGSTLRCHSIRYRTTNACRQNRRFLQLPIKYGSHQAFPFARDARRSEWTSRMVAVMSLGCMPAAFAAARDSLASSLNKSRGGATIACSITAFPLATTVKVVPSPNPHPMRIASGITTCPREDILVVGTATM